MCQDLISEILEINILEAVEARFVECEAPGFCRSGLVGGNVAWDDCCECSADAEGQLWVRLIEWIPDPDEEEVGWGGCERPGVMMVGVGALRCVPTIDEDGNPPTAQEETWAAMKVHRDSQIIRSAVLCSDEEATWIGWVPLGYEGGCGGGEHIFQVSFSGCHCDDDDSPGS
jgi:hypothetical protein